MQTTTGQDLKTAAQFLEQGELVAIPTETVYGLAANALNENAVLNVFKTKGRPVFDPLILHIASVNQLSLYAEEIPEVAFKLAQTFWPGPFTMVLKKRDIISHLVTSGLDTVALRIPNHPLTLELLKLINYPLAAPSANPFGYISPTTAQHVADQFKNKIPYILDGGPCKVGIESTIVGFENDQCVVYRLGGLSISKLEAVVGKVQLELNTSSNPRAPGMLQSHYAPNKPLLIGDVQELLKLHHHEKCAVICLKKDFVQLENVIEIIELSTSENLDEAASKFFAALRQLDYSDATLILAQKFPETGLGIAINDRLTRAATV